MSAFQTPRLPPTFEASLLTGLHSCGLLEMDGLNGSSAFPRQFCSYVTVPSLRRFLREKRFSQLNLRVRRLRFLFKAAGCGFLLLFLFNPVYYEKMDTPGRISFKGSMGCSCCRIPSLSEIDSSPVLSSLPPYHPIRLNEGKFWCFESRQHADFYCGKTVPRKRNRFFGPK